MPEAEVHPQPRGGGVSRRSIVLCALTCQVLLVFSGVSAAIYGWRQEDALTALHVTVGVVAAIALHIFNRQLRYLDRSARHEPQATTPDTDAPSGQDADQ
jgi:hypothetical protein